MVYRRLGAGVWVSTAWSCSVSFNQLVRLESQPELTRAVTNNYSIKEVLTFPMMKPEDTGKSTKLAAELVGVEPLPVEGIAHK